MKQANEYTNLEIRILEKKDQGYPVELTLDGSQQFRGGYLKPDLLPWVSSASPEDDGERLFNHLFGDGRLRQQWTEIRGRHPQRRVRLRIDAAAPELHAIPWELLRDITAADEPQTLAATVATPFSRYIAGTWPPGQLVRQRPIKILVAIANPQNLAEYKLPSLDVDEEWRSIQEATERLDVELVRLPQPCTLSALEEALKEGPHLLHLVGHGAYGQRREQAQLYLADKDNQVSRVSEAEFAAMIERQSANLDEPGDDQLRLAFLASCQTASRSPADAFRGFAPALIEAGVPAVLAMQDLIPVETARAFSRAFYTELLKHGQVDRACNGARAALLTAKLPGSSIPVLFSRLIDNQLLAEPDPLAWSVIERQSFEPETVYIPAGPFVMGSDEGQPYEGPAHTVTLPAYRIGLYPVTNREFAAFIEATGRVIPSLGWPGQRPTPEQEELPVTGVSWYLALEYCAWLSQQSGRTYALPTEAEWEKAARGPDGRRYPWGNEWQEGRANPDPSRMRPVSHYPAQSGYGCYDLVGNGREWTCSLWGSQPRQPEARFGYPQTAEQSDLAWRLDHPRHNLAANSQVRRVYRGGAGPTPDPLRCTLRRANLPEAKLNLNRHGLRLVRREG
jgi:formylglycine-generating enzyme required for sulfatase activity